MKHKVSICLITKDENSYLPEWLAWHFAQGFGHIYIYDNGSAVPVVESIPAEYADQVTVVDWPDTGECTQTAAYDHWIANYAQETEWVAFIDTDEFIRVLDGTPIGTFLADYEGADVLLVRFLTYNANGQMTRGDAPLRERFTMTVEVGDLETPCKSICRAGRLERMSIRIPLTVTHPLVMVNEDKQWPDLSHVGEMPHEKIVIDHYYTKSYEEWKEKMVRGVPTTAMGDYERNRNKWFVKLNPDLAEAVAALEAEEGEDT